MVRRLATEAKLELSAHVLRHTFVTKAIRSGADVVRPRSPATRARTPLGATSLPSQADKDAAVASP